MKRLIAIAAATLMTASMAGVAGAHHKDGHEANTHGMCTAYFSGSEDGQRNKRDNGNAFSEFVVDMADQDGDEDVDAYDVAAYCNDATGGFGNPGGGNTPFFDPEQDDCPEDDPDTPEDENAECLALGDQEGGSNPGENNGNNNPPGQG